VRRLVEMHGGRIAAHSAGLGKGSEFVVRLPLLRATTPAGPGRVAPAPAAQKARRVLVVDDNVDAAETTAMLLKAWGHHVRMAYNGTEALQAAQDFGPEIVLLDIGLPGMSGYEVAHRLRQLPKLKDIKLVAVTGYGQEDDRRRSSQAGFDEHLTKPVEPQTLQRLVVTNG